MPAPSELVVFCREHHPRLVGMLGLYCGDHQVAEDLAQEALLKICRDWPRVRRKDDPRAWLWRVALNLANSYFRRRRAERRAYKRLQAQEDHPVVASMPDTAEVFREMVARLPKRQKAALVLHYYLDLPLSEVANIMEISISAAKSLASRGVNSLRSQTQDSPFSPEEASYRG